MKKSILMMICAALCSAFCAACSGRPGEKTLLLYARAKTAYENGDFSGAAKMLEGEREFPQALILRGKALYFRGEDSKAEGCLRRALKKNPASAEAAIFLARVLRERGTASAADEARAVAEKLIANNPQDVRALRFAADLAVERGDGETAAALLGEAADAASEMALVFIDRFRLRAGTDAALEDLSRARALLPPGSALAKNLSALRSGVLEVSYE
jgi:tetratricopeptide (TPR) repeat protein